MVHTFIVSAFGSSFATRGKGSELRERLLIQRGDATAVRIDFAGVDRVTYSFADEFVGRLAEAAEVDVSLVGAVRPVADVVERARLSRGLILH